MAGKKQPRFLGFWVMALSEFGSPVGVDIYPLGRGKEELRFCHPERDELLNYFPLVIAFGFASLSSHRIEGETLG